MSDAFDRIAEIVSESGHSFEQDEFDSGESGARRRRVMNALRARSWAAGFDGDNRIDGFVIGTPNHKEN